MAADDAEFELTDADFRRVGQLLKSRAGIDLGSGKRSLVYGRLVRRLRHLRLDTFAEYLHLVADPDVPEARLFVNALTTNVTEFFREAHHFEMLQTRVWPLIAARHAVDRRVRIWSAGCSTGEEPYSLAMALSEVIPAQPRWDVRILATDLDSDVLDHARAGIYSLERAAKIGEARCRRWWRRGRGQNEGLISAGDELRSLITFKQLNLIEAWPMRGSFDVIFCRNVVIYFDSKTKASLMLRYHDLLAEPGFLFLGHSESLLGGDVPFQMVGPTCYRSLPIAGRHAA